MFLTPPVFGVSSSSGFRRRNIEIWSLSATNVRHIDQIYLYPLKTAHSECQPVSLSRRVDDLKMATAVLCWLAAAADGMDESAWARAFQTPCRGRSQGRSAPSEPMILPSETPSGARALVSFRAAPGGPPPHPTVPSFAGIAPTASRMPWRAYQGAWWLQAPP